MVNGIGITGSDFAYSVEREIKCSSLQLKILPERIHFLKFILEGYDGLALLSTVNSRQGFVEIKYPPYAEKDLTDLLHAIIPQLLNNKKTRNQKS